MRVLLLFCIWISPLIAVESTNGMHEISSEPLDLRKTLPMEIDSSMRLTLEKDTLEAERNEQILRSKTFPWEMIFFGFIAVFGVIYIKKRLEKKSPLTKPLQSEVYYQEALEIFQNLKKQKELDSNLVKDLVSKLGLAVRYSFEERFNVEAPTKTTPEFLEVIKDSSEVSKDTKAKLQSFLDSTDRIKFTNYYASLEDCKVTLESGKALLKEM